ncbi:vacuole effluxer Atg22 like-domain-containing protein [Trametes meyenii]|nr:vacuole effluxer Atg22 like-domain-containing protein [Trametes meyenii]
MERNRISNVSFAVCSDGEIVIRAVMVSILKGLHSNASTDNNTKAFSVLITFSGGVWHVGRTRECMRLKQTFLYLIFYFLMGDVLNTTVTVIGTLQNSVVSYSTLQLTRLLIVGIMAREQASSVYHCLFWLVQKRFQISTKTMLCFNVFWILILTVWGGIHTDKFGFKHIWEIWFLFFAPFSVVGKTSAFIGPLVSSAIITASARGNNDNYPFVFLFILGALSTIFLYLVDVRKSRAECEEFTAPARKLKVARLLHAMQSPGPGRPQQPEGRYIRAGKELRHPLPAAEATIEEPTWLLKANFTAFRHADRTPKQKLKFKFPISKHWAQPFVTLLNGEHEEIILRECVQLNCIATAVEEAKGLGMDGEDFMKLTQLNNALFSKIDLPGTKAQLKPGLPLPQIHVGSDRKGNAGLFEPSSIKAANGTVVTFVFDGAPGNRTVAQSVFAKPCERLRHRLHHHPHGYDHRLPYVQPYDRERHEAVINAPNTGNTFESFTALVSGVSVVNPTSALSIVNPMSALSIVNPTSALSGVNTFTTAAVGPFSSSITVFAAPSGTTPLNSGSGAGSNSGSGRTHLARPTALVLARARTVLVRSVAANDFAAFIAAVFGVALL